MDHILFKVSSAKDNLYFTNAYNVLSEKDTRFIEA